MSCVKENCTQLQPSSFSVGLLWVWYHYSRRNTKKLLCLSSLSLLLYYQFFNCSLPLFLSLYAGVTMKNTLNYTYKKDEKAFKKSQHLLSGFLAALVAAFPSHVNIMGHSMGARFLWRSLPSLSKKEQQQLHKVFWMAGDVRKNEVQSHYVNRIAIVSTNYFCKRDKPLKYSRINCGGHTRIGQSSTKVLTCSGDIKY